MNHDGTTNTTAVCVMPVVSSWFNFVVQFPGMAEISLHWSW